MLCLLAATPQETEQLRQQLPFLPDSVLPGQSFSCQDAKGKVLLVHLGIGMVSAALTLTRLLERRQPAALIAFGCGGAYPQSNLQNGDLALASHEVFGDLGVANDQSFTPLGALHLALPSVLRVPQTLVLDEGWRQAIHPFFAQTAALHGRRIMQGTFVSVNCVSGTPELSQMYENCWGGICENMEGAALALVACHYAVPLVELRGISNPCGTRERSRWDLPAGMHIAQQAVLDLLENLPRIRSQQCL